MNKLWLLVASQNARSPETGPYEEVDLPLVINHQNKKGLHYAQMELQASDSPVRQTQPKTMYAEVAAAPGVAGGKQFVVFEDVQLPKRSSSLSHKTRPSYENVESFGRRAQSVSKPRPIPAAQKGENSAVYLQLSVMYSSFVSLVYSTS